MDSNFSTTKYSIIQKDHRFNENLALDSTDSSTSTDVLDEAVVSINKLNSNRKRKTHKDHISNKHSSTKQRKKVSFAKDQQNSSELSDNNISMTEITPLLETYEQQLETFQMSQTFGTLTTDSRVVNFSDTNQPLAQTVSYHNEIQQMSTQQKAVMAQAALINYKYHEHSSTITYSDFD